MKYRLKKSDWRTGRLSISPKYVSNGYWRVTKTTLADNIMFKDIETAEAFVGLSPREMTDERMEAVTPTQPYLLKLKRTSRIYTPDFNASHHKDDRVIFESNRSDKIEVMFNRRYVEIFGLEELFGKDGASAFTNEDGTVIIMPVGQIGDQP